MFDIENSANYYEMLVADFDEFVAEPQSARKAIHCAITTYHMADWVWHDWLRHDDVTKKSLSITNENSFYAYLKRCIWMTVLHEIANGSKHFKRQSLKTQLVRGYGSGPYNVGPYGYAYLLIDLGGEEIEAEEDMQELDEFGEPVDGPMDGGDQRYLPAGTLLEVCVRFWRDFFIMHRPDLSLKHSDNHAL